DRGFLSVSSASSARCRHWPASTSYRRLVPEVSAASLICWHSPAFARYCSDRDNIKPLPVHLGYAKERPAIGESVASGFGGAAADGGGVNHPQRGVVVAILEFAFKSHTKFRIAPLALSIFSCCRVGSVSSACTRSESVTTTAWRASLRGLSLGNVVIASA